MIQLEQISLAGIEEYSLLDIITLSLFKVLAHFNGHFGESLESAVLVCPLPASHYQFY